MANILIVDDSPEVLLATSHLLESETEHCCIYATSYEAALSSLKSHDFDILLTELALGGGQGLNLVDEAKARYPKLPVIALAATGSEDLAVEAFRRGSTSYIPNRHMANRLVSEISDLLEEAKATRERNQVLDARTGCAEQFSIANDRTLFPALISELTDRIKTFELCNIRRLAQIQLGLEEALLNAMIHGNLECGAELQNIDEAAFERLISHRSRIIPYANRLIKIFAAIDSKRAVISIRDEGRGFDPMLVPDPKALENGSRAHGSGLLLIRTYFDEVFHNNRGNEIRLLLRADGR
jgi:CheY-like chemotaxis protein/anti-sigma regulatory factor (Ser/Thr protein kinase)